MTLKKETLGVVPPPTVGKRVANGEEIGMFIYATQAGYSEGRVGIFFGASDSPKLKRYPNS